MGCIGCFGIVCYALLWIFFWPLALVVTVVVAAMKMMKGGQ